MFSKSMYIILILLSVFVIYQYSQTRKFITIGRELATAAEQDTYSQTVNNAQSRILYIGDSTVVGTGTSHNEYSLPALVGKEFPNTTIVNAGINGLKTKGLVDQLHTYSENKSYDLIIIDIGGNDIVRFTRLDALEKDINTALSLAKENADHVLFLHGGNVGSSRLLPYGTRWLFTKRTRQVREIWKEAARDTGEQTVFIDIFREKDEDPFVKDPMTYYSRDMFHPSNEGYKDWYTFISPELHKILDK